MFLVSRYGYVNLPTRSADLTCCDFFLWIFSYEVQTVSGQVTHIPGVKKRNERIRAIDPDVLNRVMQSFRNTR